MVSESSAFPRPRAFDGCLGFRRRRHRQMLVLTGELEPSSISAGMNQRMIGLLKIKVSGIERQVATLLGQHHGCILTKTSLRIIKKNHVKDLVDCSTRTISYYLPRPVPGEQMPDRNREDDGKASTILPCPENIHQKHLSAIKKKNISYQVTFSTIHPSLPLPEYKNRMMIHLVIPGRIATAQFFRNPSP